MPGANCAIFGCNTSRIHKGISIFKVPKSVDDYSKKWKENVISVITRDRVIDQSLRRQIETDKLYVCEKHYLEDQILRRK